MGVMMKGTRGLLFEQLRQTLRDTVGESSSGVPGSFRDGREFNLVVQPQLVPVQTSQSDGR
ncbi:MAG: hypothetical protein ACI8TQ_003901 [Planctomycetota bacterium]